MYILRKIFAVDEYFGSCVLVDVAFTQKEIIIEVNKARLEANLEAFNLVKKACTSGHLGSSSRDRG